MTARAHDDRTSDVRGLLAELGELVGDLGLDEPVGVEVAPVTKKKAARPRAKRPAVAAVVPVPAAVEAQSPPDEVLVAAAADFTEAPEAAGAGDFTDGAHEPFEPGAHAPALLPQDAAELAELAAALDADAVPMWETATDEHEPELVPLWDAFAPELDAEPPRAWSLQAAMELVEPAAPARNGDGAPARGVLRLVLSRRPRLFTVTTVAAVLVALSVVVFSRLDLGHTSGPLQPVSKAAFQVTTMRTVDATSAAAVAQATTLSTFPAHTTQIYMDVAYRNASAGDTVRLVIDLLPPPGSGGNPVPVGDQTHQLPTGGEIAVTIQGPASGFTPGDYSVTAFHDGHLEQSLTFTVQAPASASPTP